MATETGGLQMQNNTIINDSHIRHLPPHNASYKVVGGIGLQLRKRGNSLRYIGRFKGREYPVGSPSKSFKVKLNNTRSNSSKV